MHDGATPKDVTMAQPSFSLPKQWQDWLSWILGIWLLLSPWVLMFDSETTAMRNAVLVGALIIAAEAFELSVFRNWEEWINVALGAWLIVAPWALGIASLAARANFIIVGAWVLGLAVYEIWEMGRREPRSDGDFR
jgi:SPW repeat